MFLFSDSKFQQIHIFLIAPTAWFHAAGIFGIFRQIEVLGRSRTAAGKLHRIMGYTVYALVPTNILTGFLRPKNKCARWIMIYLHWGIGVLQHGLERKKPNVYKKFVKREQIIVKYNQFNLQSIICSGRVLVFNANPRFPHE